MVEVSPKGIIIVDRPLPKQQEFVVGDQEMLSDDTALLITDSTSSVKEEEDDAVR
ncbi:MAG: hypothetical protein SWH78_14145 [Thermodesulfobacteriota bacterium]|nr:hypothetical protein [Thermodesulfobacteriota bacterium]